MKKSVESFPNHGCLSVGVEFRDRGPVGSRWGNPPIGWVVRHLGSTISEVFKHRWQAQAWAQERYAIGGWEKSRGAPYHQHYAIPHEVATAPDSLARAVREVEAVAKSMAES